VESTERIEEMLPLKPVWFQMMVALAGGATHGYRIRQEVEQRTERRTRLWPTTLYGTLARMEEAELIEEVAPPAGDSEDDVVRIYYRLTELGREVLVAETSRLEALVRLSRTRIAAG